LRRRIQEIEGGVSHAGELHPGVLNCVGVHLEDLLTSGKSQKCPGAVTSLEGQNEQQQQHAFYFEK
jgi:hypothetical protein